jgi:hypothetical protein
MQTIGMKQPIGIGKTIAMAQTIGMKFLKWSSSILKAIYAQLLALRDELTKRLKQVTMAHVKISLTFPKRSALTLSAPTKRWKRLLPSKRSTPSSIPTPIPPIAALTSWLAYSCS